MEIDRPGEAQSEIEDRIRTLFVLFARMADWLQVKAAEDRHGQPDFDGGESLASWMEENGLSSSYRRMSGRLILELDDNREMSEHLDDFFQTTVASFPARSIKTVHDIAVIDHDAAFRFFGYLLLTADPPRKGRR